MKMKIHLLLLLVLLLGLQTVIAQQENQFTLFNRNALYHNPGFTGLENYLSVGAFYRKQWANFDTPQSGVSTPRGFGISAHGKITGEGYKDIKPPYSLRISDANRYKELEDDTTFDKYTNHALGGYLYQDKFSPFQELNAALTYAYHLPLSKKLTWSVGFSAGATNSRLDVTSLSVIDGNDPLYLRYVQAGDQDKWNFDLGLGTVLYTENFYFSYSARNFLDQNLVDEDISNNANFSTHHYIGAGYSIPVNSSFDLYPSVLVKYVDNAPVDIDLMLKARFMSMIIVGASYQKDETINGILGLNVSNNLSVAYAYGYPVGELKEVQNGNHSVNLNVALFNWSNAVTKLMW